MIKRILLSALITASVLPLIAAAAPPELPLWPGPAPGAEHWLLAETVTTSPSGDRIVANVSKPTLTVYLPDAAKATGAAVVIAPGGALRLLSLDNEGVKVAQWLNSKGIAAFVLKYRTLQMTPDRAAPMPGGLRQELEIRHANANPAPDDKGLSDVLAMAVADAQQALRLVRRNASDWHIDQARVGLMGFSAGGGVAVGVTLAQQSGAVPDFMVSLYGPALQDVNVPAQAPPLFITVGSGHFNVTNGCLALFAAWKAAGQPAEIHVYDQVSAGFGMTRHGMPVDAWPDRLLDWLVARKLTTL